MDRSTTATAVVVDEWPLVRIGMAQALRAASIEVVAAVEGGEEGLRRAQAQGAAYLFLGAHRDLPVAETARRAKALPGPPRVVVLLDHTTREQLEAIRVVGVDGLLNRTVGPEELTAALSRVDAGERVVAPALVALFFETLGPPAPGAPAPAPAGTNGAPALTAKELEVLARLADNRSNKEIAELLFVSPATVKTHLGHIYAKLGVATRQEAIARAVAIGLLG